MKADTTVTVEVETGSEFERLVREGRRAAMLRVVVFALVAGLSAGLVSAALSGCTPAAQQTAVARIASGVRSAHETTNRARDAYVESQRIAEAAAVAAAQAMGGTAAEVEARGLEMLRKLDDARRPVLAAFAVAYAALARAESLVELVAAGKRDPVALMQAAMEVARTAEAVYAAVRSGAK